MKLATVLGTVLVCDPRRVSVSLVGWVMTALSSHVPSGPSVEVTMASVWGPTSVSVGQDGSCQIAQGPPVMARTTVRTRGFALHRTRKIITTSLCYVYKH